MPELLDQGLTLAAYGMGTVFIFLSLLVGATAVMSKSVNQFLNQSVENRTPVVPMTKSQPLSRETDAAVSPEILTAITGAITAHRRNNSAARDMCAESGNNKSTNH